MTQDSPNINAYLRTKVLTAGPEELRLMLLDGAIRFARQGKQGLVDNDPEASFTGITNCRNIIVELMTSIGAGVDPELALNLKNLYSFMFTELTEANLEKDTKRLDAVIELIEYERETWVMLMEKIAAERAQGRDPFAGVQQQPANQASAPAPAGKIPPAAQMPPPHDEGGPARSFSVEA